MQMHGCHNTPRADGYYAQDGTQEVLIDGIKTLIPKYVWIKDRMSKICHYDKRGTDPRCEGCTK